MKMCNTTGHLYGLKASGYVILHYRGVASWVVYQFTKLVLSLYSAMGVTGVISGMLYLVALT